MYRHCHAAIIVITVFLCCCSKNLCEQRTSIQRLFQVDRLSKWSKNAESLPSKGHLIDLNRRQTSLSGADRYLVLERKYDRDESTLSYLIDIRKREKSRRIGMKSFLEKKLSSLSHTQKFVVVVNDGCLDHHSWWLSLDIDAVLKLFESVLKNSVMEVHGNVSCQWYLNFRNYTNPPELMFPNVNVKFGMRRTSVKPYLKLTSRQSVMINITRGLREIPPNIEQDTFVFHPIFRSNVILKRQRRSPFRQSVGLLQTQKSLLPVGHVETTGLNNLNTTVVPNDVTSSEIDDEIGGMQKENFLVLISSFALVGLGAAGLAAFFIRRHRRRNDPEYRRLLPVKIVTGIYYNQSGVCF